MQKWVESEPNVRLAFLVGSQARTEKPADAFSDIDFALFARVPDLLLEDEQWVATLGRYWTSHREPASVGVAEERRVLFEDGQDVDFSIFPAASFGSLMADPDAQMVLHRGYRILSNKDSVVIPEPSGDPPARGFSFPEFSNLVNDYWFHLVCTAKKLRRGELMTALEATNGHLRALLVRLARWHAMALGRESREVWHAARFFESWADPRVIREFGDTVARYDSDSLNRALQASQQMFRWMSEEVRRARSFPNPLRDEAKLSRYLAKLFRPG
ncbi:MAG TPA: aminoglycoside 6-adenylyltransferase [Thermoplasmata archaeon]|nr:aminoglycoside 6-adenylyltransferase [Thermoplasmata archaeon]